MNLPWPDHVAGVTTHARRGGIRNSFRYGVDYVLLDPASDRGPWLFSRNRFNLTSVHDEAHGGPIGKGCGPAWANSVLARNGLDPKTVQILLLTQPRFLGFAFNPVSFWLAMDGGDLRAVIAEVSTTFGDRHSYLCHRANFEPITAKEHLTATKRLHVSPFQDVRGDYRFGFDITTNRIAIRIVHRNGTEGVVATLSGKRRPLRNRHILWAALRRPFGPLRTMVLIHWQALKLVLKGAIYRSRPTPPEREVS